MRDYIGWIKKSFISYQNQMNTIEVCNPQQPHLDPLSQIKIDSSKWIETVFITDRFLPNKKDIKNCYFNNRLLNKKETLEICKNKWLSLPKDIDTNNFFIYHKNLWIISFQKWDFVITDEWYATTDWKYIICYDNNWEELWFF